MGKNINKRAAISRGGAPAACVAQRSLSVRFVKTLHRGTTKPTKSLRFSRSENSSPKSGPSKAYLDNFFKFSMAVPIFLWIA